MAYIPPHKRKGYDPEPEMPPFKSSTSTDGDGQRSSKVINAKTAILRWFPVRLNNDLAEEQERVLAYSLVAENVVSDLLASVEHLKNQMRSSEGQELRPTLVARFGKIKFWSWRSDSERFRLSSNQEESLPQVKLETLGRLRRTFSHNIPKSYMEYILEEGAQKIGVEFEEDKDVYLIKMLDSTRPDSIISCKCRVSKDGKLELYKTELLQVRQMVMDISCLDMDVDLRLMLCANRIITSLTDDDMESIHELIDSAVLDAGVRGGARWSLGKSNSGDFSVIAVWHITVKSYVNQSVKLKLKDTDLFNFTMSTGVAYQEVFVKLKRITSELKEQNVDENAVKEMLKEDLMVLGDSFFCCESYWKFPHQRSSDFRIES